MIGHKRNFYSLLVLFQIIVLLTSILGLENTQVSALTGKAKGNPPIAEVDPSIYLTNFPANGEFIVHFNVPMNPQGIHLPIYSMPFIDGKSSWSNNYKTLTFSPDMTFEPGEDYLMLLDPNIKSNEGLGFEQQPHWDIHITRGPSVTELKPSSGLLQNRKPVISIVFDRPMNKNKTEAALSVQPAVSFSVEWPNDSAMRIMPSEPLMPGNVYVFILSGQDSGNSATDKDGIPMEGDYSWNYLFPEFKLDIEVTDKGEVSVKSNYPLTITKDMNPFSIRPRIEGSWKWISALSAVFSPIEDIPYGISYSLILDKAVKDADGDLPAPKGDLEFTATPPVDFYSSSEAVPDYIETDYSPFDFIFYAKMDHQSVEKSFSVTPNIDGRIEWRTISNSSEIFSFYPDQLLSPSVTYSFQFSKAARDRAGNAILVHPFVKTFEIDRWNETSVTFGDYGDNIQIVDINGPRYVQFGLLENEKYIQFELIPYELIEFANLYNQYGMRRYYSSAIKFIPTQDKKPITKWKYDGSTETITQTTIPGSVPAGLYVINLYYGSRLYDQLFLALTKNTITVKKSGNDLLIWVNDINDEAIKDAEIRLYSTRGEILREGKLNENGVYRTTIPDGYTPSLISARVLDSSGNADISIAGLDYAWLSDWGWGYWNGDNDIDNNDYLIYSYTDRPIYKPGQVVNFKTIVRLDNDVRYENVPDGTKVKVQVKDPSNNLLDEFTLSTNSYGSILGTYRLVDDAAPGNYLIEAIVNGQSSSQSFKVEDYRKPDFEVTLTPVGSIGNEFVAGDQFQLEVDTRYFFGEPVADAAININNYHIGAGYYYIDWWTEPNDIDYWTPTTKGFSASLNNKTTDKNGKAYITVKTGELDDYDVFYNWKNSLKYSKFALEVTANDGSNQTVSRTFIFTVNNAGEKLWLETGGYFRQPEQSFTVSGHVEDLHGNPVANRKLVLNILQWSRSKEDMTHVTSFDMTSDDSGLALQNLSLDKGFYKLVLSGNDSKGNLMEYDQWVYVFRTRDDWYSRHNDEIAIISEKQSYKPYQTAKFLVESTFSGPAMLTVERGSVIHQKEVVLTAPLTEVELPIISAYTPNIFVTINAYQPADLTIRDSSDYDYEYWMTNRPDSRLRVASTEVQVESSEKLLQVSITTEKDTYLPGEKANVTVTVKDWQGKPVTAEVSLAMVDEAIFSLSDELAPEIQKAFYGRRSHSVDTYDSMSPYREMYLGGRGGGGGGGGMGPGAILRNDFMDTAAWYPTLRTDSSGNTTVSIDLPDNITSWRLSAKAITLDHKVGEGIDNFETKKELLVLPVLPRVLTSGDEAKLSAMIHNYGPEEVLVKVTLKSPGIIIKNGSEKSVYIESGKVRRVTWDVYVTESQVSQVIISATSDSGSADAVQMEIPVQARATIDVQNLSGDFKGENQIDFLVPDILPEESSVTLSISKSPQNNILDGLEYLTGFPYGCVEQTMSRGLPNGVVGRAAVKLGLGGIRLQEQVRPYVKASIQKLYGLQHADGGWGWWEDDASDDYQTAWVIFGLSILSETGEVVSSQAVDRGVEFLLGYEGGRLDDMDPRTRAFALYSMAIAGKGDLNATRALINDPKANLDPFSSFALALALNKMGEVGQAKVILARMEGIAIYKGDKVYWVQPAGDGEYHDKTMASTIRTTALGLSAFVTIDPKNPLIPGIAQYVISERTANRGWGTTNETSYAILGLTDYLLQLQKQSDIVPYSVEVNGSSYSEGKLSADRPYIKLEFPVNKFTPGYNTIILSAQGDTLVYYDFTTRFAIPREEFDTAGVVKISREYLHPKTKQPLETIKAGDLVMVQLKVDYPKDTSYIVVEDHLPGGLEALNERLNTVSKIDYGDGYFEETYSWQELGYNKKDVLGDKVSFFITEMDNDVKILRYMARAIVPGIFTTLPAESYAMYDPDVWGRSSSNIVSVNSE